MYFVALATVISLKADAGVTVVMQLATRHSFPKVGGTVSASDFNFGLQGSASLRSKSITTQVGMDMF